MKPMMLDFCQKRVPVFRYHANVDLSSLEYKMIEYQYDFMFRKKWRCIMSIDLCGQVAIFKYKDGTKLYLEVA
ncbi:hypothetical protein [Paenibacillus selenitireducens]